MKKFLLILLLPVFVFANVTLSVPKTFLDGESVVFKITVSGNNIEFPDINNINGFPVQNAGTSSAISIINGVRDEKLIRSYRFIPTSSVTIPRFTIKINGKEFKTKKKSVILKQISKTRSDEFDLTVKINKKNAYVGEEVLLTMTFKYKKDIKLYDLKFAQPNFDNFWSKQLKTTSQPTDDMYVIQELNFLLFPQKDGILNISPMKIDAVLPDLTVQNSFFGTPTKTRRVYSNSLSLNVKPLPSDIDLIGDFKIKAKVDKSTINSGEAVSFQLEIEGRGNIDDLDEITLNIPNATIYDNPSKKDFNIQNGKYGGIYKKSYSIVSQNDFTIPSISIKYFDKQSNKIKVVKTDAYKIKVLGQAKDNQQLEVQKKNEKVIKKVVDVPSQKIITKIVKTTNKDKVLFFILGLFVASVIFIIYITYKNRVQVKEDLPLEKSIKSSKTSSDLLKKLVPYINIDEKLDKLIYQIESDDKLDLNKIKKELINILKELKI